MTPKDYLSWLDSEIESFHTKPTGGDAMFTQSCISYKAALLAAKEKFLTIQFPSQLTDTETPDPRDFTEGLD